MRISTNSIDSEIKVHVSLQYLEPDQLNYIPHNYILKKYIFFWIFIALVWL